MTSTFADKAPRIFGRSYHDENVHEFNADFYATTKPRCLTIFLTVRNEPLMSDPANALVNQFILSGATQGQHLGGRGSDGMLMAMAAALEASA